LLLFVLFYCKLYLKLCCSKNTVSLIYYQSLSSFDLMKNMFLFYILLALTFACGDNNSNDSIANKAGIMSQPTPPTESTISTTPGDYTIKVLEKDLPSPRKEMTGTIGEIKITVNYGSPAVKGRDLWGSLIAYDKVWRTGANEATSITIDQDVIVGDQVLQAGTYGLFTIPTAEEWLVVFNSTADQWGAYEYDSNKDVLRLSTRPYTTANFAENLDFMIQGNQLVVVWGKLKLPIAFETS
jgi:hypothetical protein